MSFLLTGQTDSGKSTIAGHLLWKVGYFSSLPEEDKKVYRSVLENLGESSSKAKFSVLMDLLDGELLNNKSKTREFSIQNFQYKNKEYSLIDTPGHQLYIRSLLEGLFQTKPKVVCLVLSSIENEFYESWEKGTVKEDLLLTRSVGCQHLIILWNKTDKSIPLKKMENTITSFVKSLRFESVDSLLVSGYTGENLLKIPELVNQYTKAMEKEELVPQLADNITLNVSFFFGLNQEKPLISKGLQIMLHHSTGEYEVEIEEIYSGKNRVIVIRDSTPVKLYIHLQKKISYRPGDKIVLRFQKNTIGFGIVSEK